MNPKRSPTAKPCQGSPRSAIGSRWGFERSRQWRLQIQKKDGGLQTVLGASQGAVRWGLNAESLLIPPWMLANLITLAHFSFHRQ